MKIKERVERYDCNWLIPYLKEILQERDLKMYNRVKCVIYYFPDILVGMSLENFKIAMRYPNETYICIGQDDVRYSAFDKMYMDKNGCEFIPSSIGETRYITIDEMCNFFAI